MFAIIGVVWATLGSLSLSLVGILATLLCLDEVFGGASRVGALVLSLTALKIFASLFNASSVLLPILLIGELKWLFFNASVNSPAATIALSVDDFPGIGMS